MGVTINSSGVGYDIKMFMLRSTLRKKRPIPLPGKTLPKSQEDILNNCLNKVSGQVGNMPAEIRAELVEHEKNMSILLEGISSAVSKGNTKKLKKLLRDYTSSYSVKLVCLAITCKKRKSNLTITELGKMAGELKANKDCGEPIVQYNIPKIGGGTRDVVEFGIKRQSLQLMLLLPLRIIYSHEIIDYSIVGGWHAAVAGVIKLFNDDKYTHFVICDIKDHFPSISHEAVKEGMCLRHKLVETIILNTYSPLYNPQELVDIPVQLGLAQGSKTSPFCAGLLLSRVIVSVGLHERVVLYGDDILIACTGKKEAELTLKTLKNALHECPAGPLSTKILEVSNKTDGFEFIGYRFKKHPENFVDFFDIQASNKALTKFRGELLFFGLCTPKEELYQRLIDYLHHWLQACCYWEVRAAPEWLMFLFLDSYDSICFGKNQASKRVLSMGIKHDPDDPSLGILKREDFEFSASGLQFLQFGFQKRISTEYAGKAKSPSPTSVS